MLFNFPVCPSQKMNKSSLNKLLLSRSLYQLAKEHVQSTSNIRLSIACNLLQDSVECFLLALAEHINADIGKGTQFDNYFQQINQKIAPRKLPFRLPLVSLNKLRVNSKHYGLAPAKSELDPIVTTVWEFFNEVTRTDFGKEFATLSIVEILRDGEVKLLMQQAEFAFESSDYVECLSLCRKAIYLKFEYSYDARQFLSGSSNGLLSLASKVPFYARDKKYLEEKVKQPTDFIIYDHNSIELELMKCGVDSVAYWNVWRLTPEVYRKDSSSPWIIKNDFRKFDSDGIKDRAEYVLLATTEILLAEDQNQSRMRSADYRRFYLTLKRDGTPVFAKASKTSAIVQNTPQELKQIYCDYSINGINDDGVFWHVTHWDDGVQIYGFIHEDDVDMNH